MNTKKDKTAIKLIATDMDGTFLDEKGQFDRKYFNDILTELEARGILFAVASGNGMDRLLKLFDGFEDRVIFVADNGGHIYRKGQTLYRQTLSSPLIHEVLDYLQGGVKDYCFMLGSEQRIYMAQGARHPFDGTLAIDPDQMAAFLKRITYLSDITAFPETENFYKMGLWVAPSKVERVVTSFNQAFTEKLLAVTSGYGSIDLLPAGIHKAWGLKQVMKPLGITPDQVMAFGDNDNDIEMLRFVKYSHAVENASQKVKSVAKFQVPSHTQAAVLTTIEQYLRQTNDL